LFAPLPAWKVFLPALCCPPCAARLVLPALHCPPCAVPPVYFHIYIYFLCPPPPPHALCRPCGRVVYVVWFAALEQPAFHVAALSNMCKESALKLLRPVAAALEHLSLPHSVNLLQKEFPEILKLLKDFHPESYAAVASFQATVSDLYLNNWQEGDPPRWALMMSRILRECTHGLAGTAVGYLEMEEKLAKFVKQEANILRHGAHMTSSAASAPVFRMPPSVTSGAQVAAAYAGQGCYAMPGGQAVSAANPNQPLSAFLRAKFRGVRLPPGTCWACEYLDPDAGLSSPSHSMDACPVLAKADAKRMKEASRRG